MTVQQIIALLKKPAVATYEILKDTVEGFIEDDCVVYGSSIAFYTIFSLPAILIFIIYLIGIILGEESVRQELMAYITRYVGSSSAKQIEGVIERSLSQEGGQLARAIGVGVFIFSATTVFMTLKNGLNRIWKVRPKPRKGWLKLILDRLISILVIVSFGLLMLTSLLLETITSLLSNFFTEYFTSVTFYFVKVADISSSFVLNTLVFMFIFKLLPDGKAKWNTIFYGALFTSVLFLIGRVLIGAYMSVSNVGVTYGAAGSIIIILIWIYYMMSILLLGAEFVIVLSQKLGHTIRPKKDAVKLEVNELYHGRDFKKNKKKI